MIGISVRQECLPLCVTSLAYVYLDLAPTLLLLSTPSLLIINWIVIPDIHLISHVITHVVGFVVSSPGYSISLCSVLEEKTFVISLQIVQVSLFVLPPAPADLSLSFCRSCPCRTHLLNLIFFFDGC